MQKDPTGMEEEEYFAYENDEEIDIQFRGNPFHISGKSLYRMYEHCLKPTFSSTTGEISVILLWCLIFKVSTYFTRAVDKLQHTVCFALGIICLNSLFSFSFYYIILFVLFSYITLFIASYFYFVNRRGILLIVTSLLFLIVCEGWIVNSQLWHRIRGPQMIVAMKAISLAFDLDFGRVRQIPDLICYSGYMLCPGTCIFGPWTTYNDYLSIYTRPIPNFTWIRKIISSLALAYLFLSISTCWSDYFIVDSNDLWLIIHRDALAFRASHYFISYLSEVTSVMTGFDVTGFSKEGVSVTHPVEIEFPRSIISVVTNWNIPMHHWLKVYIFATSRRFGDFFAILSTYAVSSLLHGLNFQIAAVLISISLYSYGEFMLRKKLSIIFNACVSARRCKFDCHHMYTRTHPAVLSVNIFFSFMTLLQLAYLGNVFDSGFLEEIGYSIHHTLEKWSKLHYVGHYLTLIVYLFYQMARQPTVF